MNGQQSSTTLLQTDFAKVFFDDFVINPIMNLSSQTVQEWINKTFVDTVLNLNQRYGIDASLYSDIGFIIINVFSDCLG